MTRNNTERERPKGWRHEALIVSAAPVLLICALFWQTVFTGKVMSSADVLKANFAFRAVRLEAGTHTVRFLYQPMSFTIGLVGTVVGPVACLIWMSAWGRRSRAAPTASTATRVVP